MLFTSNRPPLADHRDWGGLNWWQNLRLPYYNMLQAGDHDEIATLFEQFNRTLPVVAARTKAAAANALSLIDVQYEVLPHVLDLDEAMREGAPLLHEDTQDFQLVRGVRFSIAFRTV